MAKKEEKKRYRKGGPARLDMREGGRVSLAKGGGSSSGSTDKSRREENKEKRKQRRIDRRNARKSKTGEESGTRESLPTPKDIAAEKEGWYPGKNIEEWREGRKEDRERQKAEQEYLENPNQDSPYGYMVTPPETDTGPRGVSNMPGPSGFDTYTAGPGSSPQQTAPGEPGIGSTGVDVNPNEPTTPPPPPPPPSDIAPVAPPGVQPPEIVDIKKPEEEIKIKDPAKVAVGEELTTTELAAPTRTEAATIQDKDITPEQVSTVEDISQAQAPREVTGQEYTAEELKRVPVFDPATGAVTENMKASLDEKALTFQASGVDFTQEQKDRPLLDIVTGVLSPEAKANAAKVAGTDLPRLLRAKKQLRRAGLSEEEINLIGSDPDSLEAELGDYTEEQRGMIAGLPDEALVSTQMNTLLEGMESGEIPAFARPAVAAVNQMLAERGLSASTVGRDNLFNAVIQAAMPLAQSNAQSIKESIFQQRGIEAQAELQNAEMRQRTALSNSEKVFNMDMAQFSADQQRVMSQSKFLQTTSLQEVSNDQAAVVQTAINTAQLDIANLNTQERLQVQNAQAFLNMEMTNLDRTQQQRALNSQQEQQQMLSNQASINAARNFAATSQQQADQFMAGLAANIDQFNSQQTNAMKQFNATQENAAEARRAGREADVAKFNAELITRNDQFNAQQDFEANKWLANNEALVKQSNMDWRRKINLADTAALNAVNMQNAMNAYNAGEKEMDRLWQTARDEADFAFRSAENKKQRATTIIATAIANEGDAGETYDDAVLSFIKSTITNWG